MSKHVDVDQGGGTVLCPMSGRKTRSLGLNKFGTT